MLTANTDAVTDAAAAERLALEAYTGPAGERVRETVEYKWGWRVALQAQHDDRGMALMGPPACVFVCRYDGSAVTRYALSPEDTIREHEASLIATGLSLDEVGDHIDRAVAMTIREWTPLYGSAVDTASFDLLFENGGQRLAIYLCRAQPPLVYSAERFATLARDAERLSARWLIVCLNDGTCDNALRFHPSPIMFLDPRQARHQVDVLLANTAEIGMVTRWLTEPELAPTPAADACVVNELHHRSEELHDHTTIFASLLREQFGPGVMLADFDDIQVLRYLTPARSGWVERMTMPMPGLDQWVPAELEHLRASYEPSSECVLMVEHYRQDSAFRWWGVVGLGGEIHSTGHSGQWPSRSGFALGITDDDALALAREYARVGHDRFGPGVLRHEADGALCYVTPFCDRPNIWRITGPKHELAIDGLRAYVAEHDVTLLIQRTAQPKGARISHYGEFPLNYDFDAEGSSQSTASNVVSADLASRMDVMQADKEMSATLAVADDGGG